MPDPSGIPLQIPAVPVSALSAAPARSGTATGASSTAPVADPDDLSEDVATVVWPNVSPETVALSATVGAVLAGPSALLRFCPRGFRRRVVVRGPESLVSLLAFEPGQREHIHQHRDSGEHFHGVLGSGHLLIEDTWWPLAPGVTHFRPAGAWHGVAATSRLLLVSIQAPIPARAQTVWLEPADRFGLCAETRDQLSHFRCAGCPCCGGHLRRQRPTATCAKCGSPRAAARCENCGWAVRAICLPGAASRAG